MNGTDSSGSGAQPLDVGGRPDRLGDHRPDVLDELDVDAHPEQRQHDVGEHHGRVDVVPPHRLERHLGAQLGRLADLEERVRFRISRYSGSERPAWRMNHTGVRSTGSSLAARTRSGSDTAVG